MRRSFSITGLGALTAWSGQANAAEIEITIEILPQFVAEYHKPYVAMWFSHPNHEHALTLEVWHQQHDSEDGEPGTKWLKDIRQYWRRSGGEQEWADGVSRPSKPAGIHKVSYKDGQGVLKNLPYGDYILNVEAAREEGDRELVRIPFTWNAYGGEALAVRGGVELGDVTIRTNP